MIVVALSNLAYQRALFPNELFSTRFFENKKFKIVNRRNTDMYVWFEAIFDALDKKYVI